MWNMMIKSLWSHWRVGSAVRRCWDLNTLGPSSCCKSLQTSDTDGGWWLAESDGGWQMMDLMKLQMDLEAQCYSSKNETYSNKTVAGRRRSADETALRESLYRVLILKLHKKGNQYFWAVALVLLAAQIMNSGIHHGVKAALNNFWAFCDSQQLSAA